MTKQSACQDQTLHTGARPSLAAAKSSSVGLAFSLRFFRAISLRRARNFSFSHSLRS